METKIKEKSGTDAKAHRDFKGRNYYFHPDEDFREDHSWGKTKSAELLNSKSVGTRDSIISSK